MQTNDNTARLERTSLGTYVFEHEGMSIHDPLSSSCGRFRYDPVNDQKHSPSEYGFEVEMYNDGARSAWARQFKVGEVAVVMTLTDESAMTHRVKLGGVVRVEVSRLTGGFGRAPLAVWYQAEGALDDTPPKVIFKAPEDLATEEVGGKELSCPNCGRSVLNDREDGCALQLLIQTLRERGTKSEGRLLELHARCDADGLWSSIGKVADALEDGRFLWSD